jgi:hypothetical protein
MPLVYRRNADVSENCKKQAHAVCNSPALVIFPNAFVYLRNLRSGTTFLKTACGHSVGSRNLLRATKQGDGVGPCLTLHPQHNPRAVRNGTGTNKFDSPFVWRSVPSSLLGAACTLREICTVSRGVGGTAARRRAELSSCTRRHLEPALILALTKTAMPVTVRSEPHYQLIKYLHI